MTPGFRRTLCQVLLGAGLAMGTASAAWAAAGQVFFVVGEVQLERGGAAQLWRTLRGGLFRMTHSVAPGSAARQRWPDEDRAH